MHLQLQHKDLVHIAFYAALVAALGFIPPIPFVIGIPITAQSFGVMLAGIMLGPWRGAAALGLFVFLVALGAPFLSGGRGGIGVFTSPTMGFIIGFPFAAFTTGYVALALRKLPIVLSSTIAALVGGVIVLYMFGIAGLKLMTDNSWKDATLVMTVYIPGALVKALLTGVVAHAIARGLPNAVATRPSV